MMPFIIAYTITFVALLLYYYLSRKKNYHQTERLLGPKSHKSKNGTITSGGIVVICSLLLTFLIFNGFNLKTLFVIIPVLSHSILGLIDDFLIILKHKNDGLSPRRKLFIEIILSAITYLLYLVIYKNSTVHLFGFAIDLKFMYGMFILFIFVASSNAYNLTDGLDMLLASISLIILVGYLRIAYVKENQMLIILIMVTIAALLAFSFFNYPKAYIFIGDSGSLAIGVLMALISILLEEEGLFIWFSIPCIFETTSVILQVSYFKLTKGKRLFKMAPFHHHLELLGFSEERIVYIFIVVEIFLVVSGLQMGGYL